MKSFRLYLKHRVVPPIRVVADYQPEELARLRAEFQPAVQRYRRCMRIAYICMANFVVCVLLGITIPVCRSWYVVGSLSSWLTLMFIAILSPVPDCPACHNALDRGVGAYCPECGDHALQRGNWFQTPWCSSCGKKLTRGKARHYTIRACTHCGVPLDDKGI